MALIDTTSVPAGFTHGPRGPGRLLTTLIGILAGRSRSRVPAASESADSQLQRDPAGLVGRDVERWLDLMLRHRR